MITGLEKKLRSILVEYSLDDLAKSFFALNLWLPNVGSPIKIECLYTALECCAWSLSKANKIHSYEDFRQLIESLLKAIPSFSMLEDYAPEADWGEISYFYNGKFYKIFYGASLSNPYDFYSAYEVIHCGFEQEYIKLTGRSPKSELELCLGIQDLIICGIGQSPSPISEVIPGHLEIPAEDFWERTNQFLIAFAPTNRFDTTQLTRFSLTIDSKPSALWPSYDEFSTRSFEGKNSIYFFIKSEEKYYPVMPRKFLSVLYDTWGDLLRKHSKEIRGLNKNSDGVTNIELFKFIRDRLGEDSVFGLVSAIQPNTKPHSQLFAVAIRSKNRIVLVHLIPLSKYLTDISTYFEELSDLLKDAQKYLSHSPMRLIVWSKNEIVVFCNKNKELAVKPIFLTTIPYLSAKLQSVLLPKQLPGVVLTMDQLLGIIDEVEDADDLTSYLYYREKILSASTMASLTSPLDMFASYKDSHSVLIEGATKPTHIFMDPHWGDTYRFKSLTEFWSRFPSINFMGHPRSWAFPKDGPSNSLKSRCFRGYIYYQQVGKAVCFINAPVHLIEPTAGQVVDLVMQTIRDAFDHYISEISELNVFNDKNHIQVFCVPSSLVTLSKELEHLQHLIPNKSLWGLSITQIKAQEYGIALVFDDKKLTDAFMNATDRSVQIDLFTSVLEEINVLFQDDQLFNVVELLAEERSKKNRFKLFMITKKVSFPEMLQVVMPNIRDAKFTDKKIALLASDLNVVPGEYVGSEAKKIVDALIKGLVELINKEVSHYKFDQSIPLLLSNIDALVNDHEKKSIQISESINQEVDYNRESQMGAHKKEFLHDHQTHRYLIEKFTQLGPKGSTDLCNDRLRELLALSERILNLYAANDALYYSIVPARISISSESIATITYDDDFEGMERKYDEEQSKITLELAGCKYDVPENSASKEEYLSELNGAFKKDLGFGLRDVASVGTVLSSWATVCGVQESGSYRASIDEIAIACDNNVSNFDSTRLEEIIHLMTLRSEDILCVEGTEGEMFDVPVWEYAKRITRYTIRPIVKIGDWYHWSPFSVYRAVRLWTGMAHSHKLIAPLDAPETSSVTKKAHEDLESAMELKCNEIVGRHAEHTRMNVYPHKLDTGIADIGDYDVFAYFESAGIIIGLESKIIDPAYCYKDTRRLKEKIFGKERGDGSLREGYLQKVEKRHEYLISNAAKLFTKIGWEYPASPLTVISLFVTQQSYWWTRFPPIVTEVRFVESRLLDDFLRDLSVTRNST